MRMSEGPLPKTIQEAIPWITWVAVIFTFFLVFVEKLVEGAFGQALSALIGGGIVTAVALHSKLWLQKTNPNWVFAAALALLFAIISTPWVEQQRWPFSAWFYSGAAADAQRAELIKWVQNAQRDRDAARQQLDYERDEQKQTAAASEAQKATLVEWLQNAKNEGSKRNGTSPMVTFTMPGETPKGDTTAQECINLADSLAKLNPNDRFNKTKIEHLRSTMSVLGCGCEAIKK
jgi:hypothetical protein